MFDVNFPARLAAIIAVLALPGCGHKGPLVMPTPPARPAPLPATPAQANPADQPLPAAQPSTVPPLQNQP